MLSSSQVCLDISGIFTLFGHSYSKLDASEISSPSPFSLCGRLFAICVYSGRSIMHSLPTRSTTPQGADDVSSRSDSGGPPEARARLRKACDSCSIRKVKVKLSV